MKKNKVARISLAGGLIGLLTTNPRKALDACINNHNNEGWNAIEIIPHKSTNLFVQVLQILLLFVTLFMFTFGAGYLILFEKEV